jgi:DNA-binding NtrC family response regulator
MVLAMEMLLKPYHVRTVMTGNEAIALARAEHFDLVLLDIMLPDITGLEVLKIIKEDAQDLDAIMVTGVQQVKDAVTAMKLGAYDYIEKPFDKEHLLATIERVFERQDLKQEVRTLRNEVSLPYRFENIVGRSPSMRPVFDLIRKMCSVNSNVLVTGESGTGKELVARAIHYNGDRRYGPFVAVNCACFHEGLLESELFGHEKGAFTGADKRFHGKFETADTGTLFLDEIGNMSLPLQAKLLRVIEEMKFSRLGGEEEIEVDIRLVSATNADLARQMEAGAFRTDLYYRLKVVSIDLPGLRNRKGDIPLLVEHFMDKFYRKTGKFMKGLSDEALELLMSYHWKGNVRELENIIEMCMALEDHDVITTTYFPNEILYQDNDPRPYGQSNAQTQSLKDLLDDFEKQTVFEALEACGWNKTHTARLLGVHRNTIEKKIKRYGLEENR